MPNDKFLRSQGDSVLATLDPSSGGVSRRLVDIGNGTHAEAFALAQSGAYGTNTVSIASGQTTSGVISMATGGRLAGLQIPAAFTGTAISFQVSADNSVFGTFKQGGSTVSIPVGIGDCVDLLGAYPGLTAWPYVKIVSNAIEAAARTIGYVVA